MRQELTIGGTRTLTIMVPCMIGFRQDAQMVRLNTEPMAAQMVYIPSVGDRIPTVNQLVSDLMDSAFTSVDSDASIAVGHGIASPVQTAVDIASCPRRQSYRQCAADMQTNRPIERTPIAPAFVMCEAELTFAGGAITGEDDTLGTHPDLHSRGATGRVVDATPPHQYTRIPRPDGEF